MCGNHALRPSRPKRYASPIAACWALGIVTGLSGCAHHPLPERAGPAIAAGMMVTMEYTIRGAAGTVLRTTAGDGPFSYVHGRGELRPALELALTGMRRGDRARVRVAASEAFGLYNDAKVQRLPRARFPPDVAIGAEYEDQIGRTLRVIDLDQESVTVDWNHPLAGQDLFVDVVILDVHRPESRPSRPGVPVHGIGGESD